jgi:hypothetical protein
MQLAIRYRWLSAVAFSITTRTMIRISANVLSTSRKYAAELRKLSFLRSIAVIPVSHLNIYKSINVVSSTIAFKRIMHV